jgi:hypothetical protein
MNVFEVAVLRILIKRQQQQPPLKLSTLVSGFPDDAEDNVPSAVSNLRLQGYIMLNDYQPNGYISINRDRRKDILQIVDSDINSDKLEALHTKEENHNNSIIPLKEEKSFGAILTKYPSPQTVRTIAISSLLIVGLAIALGSSMPATSPDTESVAYHQYMPYKKWSGSAYGTDDHDDDVKNPASSYTPASASLVALKDCSQKPSQQQT